MRRILILVTVVSAMLLAVASPAGAQTTSFDASFREGFEGAAPDKPCSTGGADPCGWDGSRASARRLRDSCLGSISAGNPASTLRAPRR